MKKTDKIDKMVEKLSKNEAKIFDIPPNDGESLQRIVKIKTKGGIVLVDEQTGVVVNAAGIWREGKSDVGIVDGEELVSINAILTKMILANPMAATIVKKYLSNVKDED